jgi:hypothetical protein
VTALQPEELNALDLGRTVFPLTAAPLIPPIPESHDARAVVAREPDVDAVIRTLTQYADALTRMDVGEAALAWPSVNHRALAAAFKTLEKNGVVLNACAIEAGARDTVVATCRANVEYVRKLGSRAPRLTSQQWRFTMNRVADEWKIQTAVATEER